MEYFATVKNEINPHNQIRKAVQVERKEEEPRAEPWERIAFFHNEKHLHINKYIYKM